MNEKNELTEKRMVTQKDYQQILKDTDSKIQRLLDLKKIIKEKMKTK